MGLFVRLYVKVGEKESDQGWLRLLIWKSREFSLKNSGI